MVVIDENRHDPGDGLSCTLIIVMYSFFWCSCVQMSIPNLRLSTMCMVHRVAQGRTGILQARPEEHVTAVN